MAEQAPGQGRGARERGRELCGLDRDIVDIEDSRDTVDEVEDDFRDTQHHALKGADHTWRETSQLRPVRAGGVSKFAGEACRDVYAEAVSEKLSREQYAKDCCTKISDGETELTSSLYGLV